MDIELKFNLEIKNNGFPLIINDVCITQDYLSVEKITTIDELLNNDKIKIFSVSNIVQGKHQNINVKSFELNGRLYEDFYDFCSFNMIDNKSVEDALLKKQNIICFNGDFYFDCSNKNKIKYFSTYYSAVEDDFIFWNGFIDCDNEYGCLKGETPHINSWSNVPYDIKKIKKNDIIDVACYGCSVTYGHGVSKKHIWPSLLKNYPNNLINFGCSAGGIDTIYNNFKNSLKEFTLKKVIILLPNLERRFLTLSKGGYFFRIPITVNIDLDAILPNIWFSDEYLKEEIKKIENQIVLDKNNEYSKNILKNLLELLAERNIPSLISSWDKDCYEVLKTVVERDNLLTYFDRIDSAVDGLHHGPLSHQQWIVENKNKLSNFLV